MPNATQSAVAPLPLESANGVCRKAIMQVCLVLGPAIATARSSCLTDGSPGPQNLPPMIKTVFDKLG